MKRKKRSSRFPMGKWMYSLFGIIRSGIVGLMPAAACFLIFVLAFYGIRESLYADDFFKLETVRVQTDGILNTDEVRSLAGVKIGQNILRMNLGRIAERLNSDPRIKSAVVERSLPNALGIRVRERRAFLRVKTPFREAPQIIDKDGFYLGDAHKDSDVSLLVDLRPEAKQYFGTKNYRDRSVLTMLLAVRDAFAKDPLFEGRKMLEVQIHASYRIHLLWEGGLDVRIGKNWRSNLKKLDAVRTVIREELADIEYVDLRFSDIVVKKKEKSKVSRKGNKN